MLRSPGARQGAFLFAVALSASTSLLFKTMNVTRMLDREKGVIIYLVTSTKLINGSPFNSVSVITTGRQ